MEENTSRQPLVLRGRTLTRRELLVGAGMVAGGLALGGVLAACGPSSGGGGTSGTPKRGGNFRLGGAGGGAKDISDGPDHGTKPNPARLGPRFETPLVYTQSYNLTPPGLPGSVTQ